MDYSGLEWRETVLLGCALREGIVGAVSEGWRPADEVAGEIGLDERATGTVLSALAGMGVLEESEGAFRLLEEHRGPLLDPDRPNYAGGSVIHRFQLIRGWSRMPEILESGEPAADRSERDQKDTANFTHAMRRGARESADAVAGMLLSRLPQGAHVLDAGGGPGTNARAFVEGGARVTVFDLPGVMEIMEGELHDAGVETVAGDMNEELPEGPFDAVHLGNVSHIYGPEKNRKLFERVWHSLAPGGLICIRDFVRGRGGEAALFAVNMLIFTDEGGTYTEEQYREWLSGAGFGGIGLEAIPGRDAYLIFAREGEA